MDFSSLEKFIVTDNPLLRDQYGEIKYRVGTFFPEGDGGRILTGPTIHAILKLYYIQVLNGERAARGQGPLDPEQSLQARFDAVDLIMNDAMVYIRPHTGDMDLTFRAEAYVRRLGVPRHLIRFIDVRKAEARSAINRRGERWRAQEMPKTDEDIREFITSSRITLGTRAVYYFSHATGTKYMTYHQFSEIGRLPAAEMLPCLLELRELSEQKAPDGSALLVFFRTSGFGSFNLELCDLHQADEGQVMKQYSALKRSFQHSTEEGFAEDNLDDPVWKGAMVDALLGPENGRDRDQLEEEALGLSREFRSRVAWLPGGTVRNGLLEPDEVFDSADAAADDMAKRLLDRRVIGIIRNFLQDIPDLQYINVGRVESSMSRRKSRNIVMPGIRLVYVAVYRSRAEERDSVGFIRFQKKDVSYFLDMGYDLDEAERAAAAYGASVMRRIEACRRLRLNVIPTEMKRIRETYRGVNLRYRGSEISSGYFLRGYAFGYATDKIPSRLYQSAEFAGALATLLGRAAASSIILGRLHDGEILFDDGDEVLLLDERKMPADIVVTDITSAFSDVEMPLAEFAGDFVFPVISRTGLVPDADDFKRHYIDEFSRRFGEIRNDYIRNRDAYLGLFSSGDADADFCRQWTGSLRRLEETDVRELAEIMENFSMGA
ncbi:MAG: hypothetical protein JXA20_04835 [Spirochaetes bacterium]|nr:hypothetical protein [Spirochaetota bacterium]